MARDADIYGYADEDEDVDNEPERYVDCPNCDGTMVWCSLCDMYTQTCCVDYGTCPCN